MPVPSRGKKRSGPEPLHLEGLLWKATDTLRGSMDASEYKHVVLGLIFLKHVSDAYGQRRESLRKELVVSGITGERADELLESRDEYTAADVFWVPPEARWSYLAENANLLEIGQLIDDAMDLIERHNPELHGVLPKTYDQPTLDMRRLADLVDLFSDVGLGAVQGGEKDILGGVYEHFLGRFASAEGKSGGEFYTPRSVVRLMVEMTEPYSGRIYDPCCGSGGMFVLVERFIEAHGGRRGDIAIYGQELNHTTWRLAKMNLAIHGLEGDLGPRWGDSFHEDLHPGLKADYVLANPPFNVSGWGAGWLHADRRWCYGQPPAGNANFAWLQHVVSHLSPRGIAGVVLTEKSTAGHQPSEACIRQRMIEDDLVECIVALPEQLFYSTQVPVTLWLLNRDKTPGGGGHWRDRQDETLFIDARNLGVMANRTHRRLSDDDLASITGTYYAWRGGPGAVRYADVPGFCSSATTREIAERHYVLTPGIYVGARDISPGDERPEDITIRPAKDLAATGWPASRLVDFVEKVDYLRSGKAPERAAKIVEFRDQKRLVLPFEAHLKAAYGTVPDAAIPNRCLLVSLAPGINGAFLAAWLNSDDGREIRAAAMPGTGTAKSPRTISAGTQHRFLDDLMVPTPSLDVQAAIADTLVMLAKVQQRTGHLAAELWRTPSLTSEIQPIVSQWLDSTS